MSISDAPAGSAVQPASPAPASPAFASAWVVCEHVDRLPAPKQQSEGRPMLEKALAQFPGDVGLTVRLAGLEWRAGQADAARARLHPLLASGGPAPAAAHVLAVRMAQAAKDRPLFEARLRAGLAQAGNSAELQLIAGLDLFEKRQYRAAVKHLEAAVNLQAFNIPAIGALGRCLEQAGDLDRAARVLEIAVRLDPENGNVQLAFANVLQRLDRCDESLNWYRRYAGRAGRPAFLFTNIGALYRRMGRLEEARTVYDRGLALEPANAGMLYNLSNLLKEMGDLDGAIRALRRAIAVEPENAQLHWNFALALLADGRMAEGFAEYEWRWRYDGFPSRRRDFAQPMWDGRPFAGKTLLIHTEQGMGDVFQFLRYLPRIRALGGRIVLESHEPLIPLLEGMPEIDAIIPRFAPPPPFDLHLPLLSAPLVLGHATLDDIPRAVPYVPVPPEARFPIPEADPDRLKVGIIWGGNPQFSGDRARSSRLKHFLPLLDVAGVQLFSLQKGPREDDLADAPPELVRLSDRIGDFRDTAAAMRQLDIVISTCTSTAHLAGALGIPVWVVLHHAPDWRWMLGRDDSPWYPTARLFRQRRAGDWDGVLAEVAGALREQVAAGRHAARTETR
ncbi:MAG TPA: tetratricopeptide repeat-containing glycosyltransferase family protein [Azospirillum sp.]